MHGCFGCLKGLPAILPAGNQFSLVPACVIGSVCRTLQTQPLSEQSVEQPRLTLCFCIHPKKQRKRTLDRVSIGIRRRPILPGRVQPSTIGAEGLNFCVRYGNRWDPFAIATGNCIIVMGLEDVSFGFLALRFGFAFCCFRSVSTCPRLLFCFLCGKSFSSRKFLRLLPWVLPAFRAAHPSGCVPHASGINACYDFTLRYFRPLSHPDNCTKRKEIYIFVDHSSQSRLKSSPRPISIVKLHVLPHFHRRPITW